MEMGVFAATALLIGDLDAQSGETEGLRLCGHQIAIQLASLSFMVPLGVGIAGSVRVGWAIGRGEPQAARRTALAALCCGALVMSAFMLLFLLAPEFLAGVLASDPRAVAWGAALLPIAGVFQIGDGLQVTAIGLLRGAGDVRSPFWINLVGYWAIAPPHSARRHPRPGQHSQDPPPPRPSRRTASGRTGEAAAAGATALVIVDRAM